MTIYILLDGGEEIDRCYADSVLEARMYFDSQHGDLDGYRITKDK